MHVNRMCLAAKVPLVESGTAGYLGQVSVHVGGVTECFECQPKPTPKSYAVCTIRTSPDKPIHCVVWAKDLLFRLLFGPSDPENDLDPNGKLERRGDEGAADFAKRVFNHVFSDKITEVLETADEDVWDGRQKPVALDVDALMENAPKSVDDNAGTACTALKLSDQHVAWTPEESAAVFLEAAKQLLENRKDEVGSLTVRMAKEDCLSFILLRH